MIVELANDISNVDEKKRVSGGARFIYVEINDS